ncbi:MAG: nucleotide sugar dehydrogenase [Candidatus Omnitrophica bacterium]|nr:nucleotide sugar dehydrogenase [Candidatus Omnitrophota bacterium]
MDWEKILRNRILKKQAKICIIGLGYVGLPLAVAFNRKGFFVWGLDNNPRRINNLNKGIRYIVDIDPKEVLKNIKQKKFFPTTQAKVLKESDVIIICVPTPLRKVKIPDISYILKAAKDAKKYLRKGQLIILESTSFPTTTRTIVLPILKQSGLKEEKDFFLCFSPERVNPGDREHPLIKIPKIVGGLSPKSTKIANCLYSKIINKVYNVSSPEVAESCKLLENTFRLVNIALVNEFAVVAHKLGINVWEVVEAAKTKPFGYMPFYPGPGVGGHCIPDDPVYLSWKAKKLGFKTKMIDLASYMNHFMPRYVFCRIKDILDQKKVLLRGAKILIMGVTYKKDVKDLRESPALDIIELLQKQNARVSFYDPLIPFLKINAINLKRISLAGKSLNKFDCVVIITDNSNVDYMSLRKKAKFIFDTRNVYKKDYNNVIRL